MTRNPVVLVHGYSSSAGAFEAWRGALTARGIAAETLHACSYRSLTNEVTLKDIAEGFERALRMEANLAADEPFDAVVHSTGMLVIRAWLTAPFRRDERDRRRRRLKRLIALAPATNGSPLAHKGRGWLGAMLKGHKNFREPDFLEAGDLVLDGLELASRFTWDLAHCDLFGDADETYYGKGGDTPFVFVFCGNNGYGGLAGLVNDPGSDGTVRVAGAAMDSRKLVLDLTHEPGDDAPRSQLVETHARLDVPAYIVPGKDHGTIMSNPGDALISAVAEILATPADGATFDRAAYDATTMMLRMRFPKPDPQHDDAFHAWQQFVIRCVDERGDPITDYNIQIVYNDNEGLFRGERDFDVDVHTYRRDASLRCFHINLTKLEKVKMKKLGLRVIASSGSVLVTYHGHGSERFVQNSRRPRKKEGIWDAKVDLTEFLDRDNDSSFSLFYPFTTTFLEIRLNREPLPLSMTEKNHVCWFGDAPKFGL